MPDKYTAQNSILINCSLCGKEFSRSLSEYRRGSDSRFCCIVCRNRSLALDKLNKRIPCPICGKPFYAGSRNQKKTCSIGCKLEKGRLGKTRNCAYCGDEFITKNPGSKAKFCSIKCVGLSHIRVTPHKCEHCGIEFLPDTTTRIRRFCSSECRKSYMKGSNHPLWRGNRKHERGATWKAAAIATRLRDSVCVGCGYCPTEERLSVDYIVPFRLALIYAFTDNTDPNDLRNLVCLCRSCHGKKTRIEYLLLSGNLDEFVRRLSAIIPSERINLALEHCNIGSGVVENSLSFERLPRFITESIQYQKVCLECSVTFTAASNRPDTKYCSPRCNNKMWRKNRKISLHIEGGNGKIVPPKLIDKAQS